MLILERQKTGFKKLFDEDDFLEDLIDYFEIDEFQKIVIENMDEDDFLDYWFDKLEKETDQEFDNVFDIDIFDYLHNELRYNIYESLERMNDVYVFDDVQDVIEFFYEVDRDTAIKLFYVVNIEDLLRENDTNYFDDKYYHIGY